MFLVLFRESFTGDKNNDLIIVVPKFFCLCHRVEWAFYKIVHIATRMSAFAAFTFAYDKFEFGFYRTCQLSRGLYVQKTMTHRPAKALVSLPVVRTPTGHARTGSRNRFNFKEELKNVRRSLALRTHRLPPIHSRRSHPNRGNYSTACFVFRPTEQRQADSLYLCLCVRDRRPTGETSL